MPPVRSPIPQRVDRLVGSPMSRTVRWVKSCNANTWQDVGAWQIYWHSQAITLGDWLLLAKDGDLLQVPAPIRRRLRPRLWVDVVSGVLWGVCGLGFIAWSLLNRYASSWSWVQALQSYLHLKIWVAGLLGGMMLVMAQGTFLLLFDRWLGSVARLPVAQRPQGCTTWMACFRFYQRHPLCEALGGSDRSPALSQSLASSPASVEQERDLLPQIKQQERDWKLPEGLLQAVYRGDAERVQALLPRDNAAVPAHLGRFHRYSHYRLGVFFQCLLASSQPSRKVLDALLVEDGPFGHGSERVHGGERYPDKQGLTGLAFLRQCPEGESLRWLKTQLADYTRLASLNEMKELPVVKPAN